jgi:hypothetical protein
MIKQIFMVYFVGFWVRLENAWGQQEKKEEDAISENS